MATSKQDRTYARTASDIERKYNFGKSFGEVFGLIDEAKQIAKEAEEAVSNLDTELDQEEIFNRLTNAGKVQGIYRDENGDIYINGQYVKFVGATIGGWEITDNALYKDVTASDGTVYRVWLQPPGGDNPGETWILSCQQKVNGAFYGIFVLYADGSAKFGNVKIDNEGNIDFNGQMKIYYDGTIIWRSTTGGDYPAQITRQSDGSVNITIGHVSAKSLAVMGDGTAPISIQCENSKNSIIGLTAPLVPSQATNKEYVDAEDTNLQTQIDKLKKGKWTVTSVGTATTSFGKSFTIKASEHDFLYIQAIVAGSTCNIFVPLALVATLGTYSEWYGYSATGVNVAVTSTKVSFTGETSADQTTSLKVYYLDRNI